MKIATVRIKSWNELKEIAGDVCPIRGILEIEDSAFGFNLNMEYLCELKLTTILDDNMDFKIDSWIVSEWMYDIIEEKEIYSNNNDWELLKIKEKLNTQDRLIMKLKEITQVLVELI